MALILAALAFFIRGLYTRLSVLDFLASHSTGYYPGYAAPEDAEWYTIENERFGIDSTGGNARATTDGINAALLWAKEQGYTHIRFPRARTPYNACGATGSPHPRTAYRSSGLTLDLATPCLSSSLTAFRNIAYSAL